MPTLLNPATAAMAKPGLVLTERRSAVLAAKRKTAEVPRQTLRCVVLGDPSCEKAGLARWLTNFPHHSLEKLTSAAAANGEEKELAAALAQCKESGWSSVLNGDVFDSSATATSSSTASAASDAASAKGGSAASGSESGAANASSASARGQRTFVVIEERTLEASSSAPLRVSRGRSGSTVASEAPRFDDRALDALLADADAIDVVVVVFDDLDTLEYAKAVQRDVLAHAAKAKEEEGAKAGGAALSARRCPPFVFVCDLANPLKQKVPERDIAEYESSGEIVDGTSLLAAAQAHCETFGLHRPLLFSASREKAVKRRAALYRRIVDAARFPLADGHTPRPVNAQPVASGGFFSGSVIAFLGLALVAVGGWFAWTTVQEQQAKAQKEEEEERAAAGQR